MNCLLQGPVYSVIEFSQIAKDLDQTEQMRMSEQGINSPEYQRFMAQPSNNMDDTGFFSIQVIIKALELWQLEMIQFNSSDVFARRCTHDPTFPDAYIINMESHWFCLRKLDGIWFNLDSLLDQPKFMSNLYIGEYLQQMAQEGYTIYTIKGDLSRVKV